MHYGTAAQQNSGYLSLAVGKRHSVLPLTKAQKRVQMPAQFPAAGDCDQSTWEGKRRLVSVTLGPNVIYPSPLIATRALVWRSKVFDPEAIVV